MEINSIVKILKFFVASTSILLSTFACSSRSHTLKTEFIEVETPFEMKAIEIPDFSESKVFLITDFGAEKGHQKKNLDAIHKAIDAANRAGGGKVVVPAGEWLTGPIHFKSNVNLHLQEGAVLLFSGNPDDYLPAVHTTWEGMECYNYSPLIYAYECQNIAITGKGEIRAIMDTWKEWFARPQGHMQSLKRLYYLAAENIPVEERMMVNDSAHFRPHFVQFNRCQKVLMDGIKVTNSPFWTIHPYLCKDVVIRNLKVYAHGHNNDGVDPEMSQNVLIENCELDQGDDAVSIKSGRNQEAWRLNTPSKNIILRNLTVKNGHQLAALGSELSGGIENVLVENCEVLDGAKLFHLLFIKTNERRGGYVKNIHFRNIKSGKIEQGIMGIETDVLYQWRDLVPTLEKKLTVISDITLENVSASEVQFISRVLGDSTLPVSRISFKNVKADKILNERTIHENLTDFTEE